MVMAHPLWQRALEWGVRVLRPSNPVAPTWDPELAAEGRYIFVHDDDVSRMDAVVRWLRSVFGLTANAAAKLMLQVHRHGIGALGPFEVHDAERLLAQGRRLARELGVPTLHITRDPPPAPDRG